MAIPQQLEGCQGAGLDSPKALEEGPLGAAPVGLVGQTPRLHMGAYEQLMSEQRCAAEQGMKIVVSQPELGLLTVSGHGAGQEAVFLVRLQHDRGEAMMGHAVSPGYLVMSWRAMEVVCTLMPRMYSSDRIQGRS